jgi:hypothetical protein
VTATVQLVQDRDQREQVPAGGCGVGEDPRHIYDSKLLHLLLSGGSRASIRPANCAAAFNRASLRVRSPSTAHAIEIWLTKGESR